MEQLEPFKLMTIVVLLACCCVSNLVFLIWRRRKVKSDTNETQTFEISEGVALFTIPSEKMECRNTDKTKTRVGSYSTLANTLEAIEIGQMLTLPLDELSEQPGACCVDETA